MATAPPGWYPDPWRVGPSRWWDGYQWTAHVGGHPQTTPTPAGSRLPAVWRVEGRLWPWARAAVVAWGFAVVAEACLFLGSRDRIHRQFHQFFQQFRIQENFDAQATPHLATISPPGGPLLGSMLDALGVAVAVIFLIWQYNAACTARSLGYRSRVSPGLGVGSWFIPVVNLWFPYRALADCLPPGHPSRSRGIWAWLAYLVTGGLVSSTYLVAIFSPGTALLLGILAVAGAVLAVGLGWGLMTAINADHRRAVQALG